MKKLLFTVLGLSLLSATAQTYVPKNYPKEPNQPNTANEVKFKKESAKRDLGSFWFSTIDLMNAKVPVGGGTATFTSDAQLMYPDSNVIVVPGGTNPNFHWWFHGVGASVDPLDEDWSVTDEPGLSFSRYNNYTWDSLRFLYYYPRKVDFIGSQPVVDTLYVHYFLPANLTFNAFTGGSWTVGQKFAYPTSMNYSRSMPSISTKIDTILLTKDYQTKDSGGFIFAGVITMPINIANNLVGTNVNTRSTVAATITYQPMTRGKMGDTIAVGSGITEPFNKINQFRCNMQTNTGAQISNENSYTVGLLNTSEVKYGQVISGFVKNYIPGTLYNNRRYWNADFHFTTNNLAIKNTNKEVSLLNAYPNPASSNSEVVLSLNSLKNTTAVITISDISGKIINTMNTEITNGSNSILLSTKALSNGLYIITVKGDDFTSSSKLIIE